MTFRQFCIAKKSKYIYDIQVVLSYREKLDFTGRGGIDDE